MQVDIHDNVAGLMRALGSAVTVNDNGSGVTVNDTGAVRGELMDSLAWNAAFGENGVKEAAIWLIRAIGEQVGVIPASIHDYYMAAGRGEFSRCHRPCLQYPGDDLRFVPRRPPRRAIARCEGTDLRNCPLRTRLHRAGAGGIRRAGNRCKHPGRIRRPRLHSGRSCASQCEELCREPGQGNLRDARR